MLQESFSSGPIDMAARALAEQQVDADRLVQATRSALAADRALLSETQLTQINAQLENLVATRRSTDPLAIKQAIQTLAQATEEFAALRMNAAVQQALAGRNINEIA
jgi:molecular chaperone HscA